MAISEVKVGREEALEIAEYPPISFETEAERDLIEFHWSAFQSS